MPDRPIRRLGRLNTLYATPVKWAKDERDRLKQLPLGATLELPGGPPVRGVRGPCAPAPMPVTNRKIRRPCARCCKYFTDPDPKLETNGASRDA